jgi:yecA family protein
VNPVPEFSREDALALQKLLASPSRPQDAMGYFEAAGFLFAVCCSPDSVQPSEWVPIVLDEKGGGFADFDELQRALQLVMALHNHINEGVLQGRPELPWGCDVRADPLANLEEDAPLSRWARGFAEGSDWLQASWPDELPEELGDGLGACMLVLSFFASRQLAEAYWKESRRLDMPLAAMAKQMQEMLPRTMAAYAGLGRGIHEGMLAPKVRRPGTGEPEATRSSGKRRRGGKR